MTAADIAVVLGAAGAPLALIGGGITWMVKRIDKLDDRMQRAEKKSVRLERGYARVVIQVQRWRTAFQIVAAELQRLQPENPALRIAQAMLIEPIATGEDDDDVVDKDQDLLFKLNQETPDADAL